MSNVIDEFLKATESRPKGPPKSRSEIAFPYTHLEDTLPLLRAIENVGGLDAPRALVAEEMGIDLNSSGFTVRLGSARTFGLVIAADGNLRVTQLGRRILDADENESAGARREAFLTVPLYRRVFDEFKGEDLPERPIGLQDAFVKFGVSSKQKDKARLAFERSATFAGFFAASRDRLVDPLESRIARQAGHPLSKPETGDLANNTSDRLPAAQQSLILGLLERVPKRDWSVNDRVRWLRALAVNLSLLYGKDDEPEILISIKPRS